jgi:hypothetical protein
MALNQILMHIKIHFNPCGVAQWTSHPPQEQKTKVRIPPGLKFFQGKHIIAVVSIDLMLFCLFD